MPPGQLGYPHCQDNHSEHYGWNQITDHPSFLENYWFHSPDLQCTLYHTRKLGQCYFITGYNHWLTQPIPNLLRVDPISSANLSNAYVTRNVVSLRACTFLGSTWVQLIRTPFVTSSFQSVSGSISFPSINMHTISIVFGSVVTTFMFTLFLDIITY